jgi:hypothetical protein
MREMNTIRHLRRTAKDTGPDLPVNLVSCLGSGGQAS